MIQAPPYLDYFEEPLALDDPKADSASAPRFPRQHVFDDIDIDAINTALAVGRPLLVRGEPGAGKSQLALAAAVALRRAFVKEVVDARTESRDLLWRFDAVRRLADAQVISESRLARREQWIKKGADPLDESFYIAPGVLWWALHWSNAELQAETAETAVPKVGGRCSAEAGVVVLLDEIDKADSSVPNGLLGVLGDGEFTVPGVDTVHQTGPMPLVIITTNEERSLPDAFLRRCVVHEMELDGDRGVLRQWLVCRGRAQYGARLPDDLYPTAADLLIDDREAYRQQGLTPPGCAEYLDLLRAVVERSGGSRTPDQLIEQARGFLFRKHPSRD